MAYENLKDLIGRTDSDKILRDKVFNIGKIRDMMEINVDLLQWSRNVFDKKASGNGIKNDNISNKELAEESQKPTIKKS